MGVVSDRDCTLMSYRDLVQQQELQEESQRERGRLKWKRYYEDRQRSFTPYANNGLGENNVSLLRQNLHQTAAPIKLAYFVSHLIRDYVDTPPI